MGSAVTTALPTIGPRSATGHVATTPSPADGEYQPIVAAAAGTPFRMIEPFEFTIDPPSLLDD